MRSVRRPMDTHGSKLAERFDQMIIRRRILAALYVALPVLLAMLYISQERNMPLYYLARPRAGSSRAFFEALYVIWPYALSAIIFLPRATGTRREFWAVSSALLLTTGALALVLLTPAALGEDAAPLWVYTTAQTFILIFVASTFT